MCWSNIKCKGNSKMSFFVGLIHAVLPEDKQQTQSLISCRRIHRHLMIHIMEGNRNRSLKPPYIQYDKEVRRRRKNFRHSDTISNCFVCNWVNCTVCQHSIFLFFLQHFGLNDLLNLDTVFMQPQLPESYSAMGDYLPILYTKLFRK